MYCTSSIICTYVHMYVRTYIQTYIVHTYTAEARCGYIEKVADTSLAARGAPEASFPLDWLLVDHGGTEPKS